MEEFAFYSYLTGLIAFLLVLPVALKGVDKNLKLQNTLESFCEMTGVNLNIPQGVAFIA